MLTRTFFNRSPLTASNTAAFPVGAIRALGTSRDFLLELRAGLLAQSASLFPEAGAESSWYGGPAAGGMLAPHLLEAMVLTAGLLRDTELQREAVRLTDSLLHTQREDGCFGSESETFTTRGRMLRALCASYSLTGNREILTFILRYFRYLQETMRSHPFSREDSLHTADTIEAGIFVYNITGQKALLSVLEMLTRGSIDFTSLFTTFPYKLPISRQFSAEELLEKAAADGYVSHLLMTANGANLCEGLRATALCGLLTGSNKQLSAAERGLARMNKAHGSVSGGITADPLLAGTHPSRGVTAASLTELTASLETLLSCPGGTHNADQWESAMYNGIMAAFSENRQSVQPIQQANQIRIDAEERFPLSGPNASLFSVQDGETVCRLLSAVARFYQHQWMLTKDAGVTAMGYAPCSIRYRLHDAMVELRTESRYPEDGNIRISLQTEAPTVFPVRLRIPGWAHGATAAVGGSVYEGEPDSFITINREWQSGDEILLTLPMSIEREVADRQAVTITRGPLAFCFQPESTRSTLPDGSELLQGPENFGFALVTGSELTMINDENGLRLCGLAVPIQNWTLVSGSCDRPPIDPALASSEESFEIMLVPYARAAIRIAVFPVC